MTPHAQEVVEKLRRRAYDYRLGGPSFEHTAALFDEVADLIIASLTRPVEGLETTEANAGSLNRSMPFAPCPRNRRR